MYINDVVLVRVKAFGNDRKVADKWEEHPYRIVETVYQIDLYSKCKI